MDTRIQGYKDTRIPRNILEMKYAYTTVEYMYTRIQGFREIFLK